MCVSPFPKQSKGPDEREAAEMPGGSGRPWAWITRARAKPRHRLPAWLQVGHQQPDFPRGLSNSSSSGVKETQKDTKFN